MRAGASADVLVVVEDVVGVVRGLHVHQPVVDGVAIRLADPVGVFVAAEEVDVNAFAEAAEGGEELSRPGRVPVAEVLAGPPHTLDGESVRRARKTVVKGKSESAQVDHGGRRFLYKKKKTHLDNNIHNKNNK